MITEMVSHVLRIILNESMIICSKVGVVSRSGDEAADGDQRETDAAAAQGDDGHPGMDDQHGGQDLQVRLDRWIFRMVARWR